MRSRLDRVAARVSQAFSSVWAALVAVLLAAAWIVAAFGGGLASSWEFPHATTAWSAWSRRAPRSWTRRRSR